MVRWFGMGASDGLVIGFGTCLVGKIGCLNEKCKRSGYGFLLVVWMMFL